MDKPAKRYHTKWTIGSVVPLIKSRIETIDQYLSIIVKGIGLKLLKTECKEEP